MVALGTLDPWAAALKEAEVPTPMTLQGAAQLVAIRQKRDPFLPAHGSHSPQRVLGPTFLSVGFALLAPRSILTLVSLVVWCVGLRPSRWVATR